MTIIDELQNNRIPIDTIKIIDYVISLQISKINKYSNENPKKTLSADTEEAMANLISLIELRNDSLNKKTKRR